MVHLLMVYPFLSPENAWNMMHAKADAMGMAQQVAHFLDWIRALTGVDFADSALAQRQGIRTSLVPPPPLLSLQSSRSLCSSRCSCKT